MADEADKASDYTDEILRRSIAYTSARTQEVEAIGVCLNCGEEVPEGVRWCDAGCRDDWTKRNWK